MARYKTFVADGTVPNGRLYAGDLNGIQDAFVSLSDFTQTLDVGTLRVGDATLQLFKYGAGEFRMTGAMRFDGILRGLSGIIAGAFTTTQRDAIAAGFRPYGLTILNTTTNQYEWNSGTDPAPVWIPLGGGALPGAHASTHVPGGSDGLNYGLVNLVGTRAAKPAASGANNNLLYFETDWNSLWRSNGSAWVRVGSWPKRVTVGEFSTLSPSDGDEVIVEISASLGIKWHLIYNSASGSAYKWEYVGGPPLFSENLSVGIISSSSYSDIGGPSISIPRDGDYDIEIGFRVYQGVAGEKEWLMSYKIGAASASDNDAVTASCASDDTKTPNAMKMRRKAALTAVTLASVFKKVSGGASGHALDVWMKATPVRIA
jgi:hypothetical protein